MHLEARAKCSIPLDLDPQVPEIKEQPKISSLDQRGRHQQVPGGPEPRNPWELIFKTVFSNQSYQARLYWSLEGDYGQPGSSGPSTAPKTSRRRPRARTSQEIHFLGNLF